MLAALAYHRPRTVPDAVALLAELGADALPLAGGTDLVVDLERGLKQARHLVSLRDLEELRGIAVEGGVLRIGALVTAAALGRSPDVQAARPELEDAVRVFGSPPVRNRATLGGNLCSAASCGDLPPLLIALAARAVVAGPEGEREVGLEDLFVDARRTALDAAELLVAVRVPVRRAGEGTRYEAFGRRGAAFITVAGVAAWVRLEGNACRGARVVLGAVAPTPRLVPEAAAALEGRVLDQEAFGDAARAAGAAARPITDVRGSAAHRRELVAVLAARALRAAGERARA